MSVRQVRLALSRALARVSVRRLGILLDIANRLSSRKDGKLFYSDLTRFVREWKSEPLARCKNLQDPMPKTLKEFVASPLYPAVLKRLKASGRYILLGESDTIMSRSSSISLDGEGFVRSHQVVGMAAAYTDEKPSKERASLEDAIRDIYMYSEGEGFSEAKVVQHIVDSALDLPEAA